jgi:hypothetical protein
MSRRRLPRPIKGVEKLFKNVGLLLVIRAAMTYVHTKNLLGSFETFKFQINIFEPFRYGLVSRRMDGTDFDRTENLENGMPANVRQINLTYVAVNVAL